MRVVETVGRMNGSTGKVVRIKEAMRRRSDHRI
jgi:hypothetical protein